MTTPASDRDRALLPGPLRTTLVKRRCGDCDWESEWATEADVRKARFDHMKDAHSVLAWERIQAALEPADEAERKWQEEDAKHTAAVDAEAYARGLRDAAKFVGEMAANERKWARNDEQRGFEGLAKHRRAAADQFESTARAIAALGDSAGADSGVPSAGRESDAQGMVTTTKGDDKP